MRWERIHKKYVVFVVKNSSTLKCHLLGKGTTITLYGRVLGIKVLESGRVTRSVSVTSRLKSLFVGYILFSIFMKRRWIKNLYSTVLYAQPQLLLLVKCRGPFPITRVSTKKSRLIMPVNCTTTTEDLNIKKVKLTTEVCTSEVLYILPVSNV